MHRLTVTSSPTLVRAALQEAGFDLAPEARPIWLRQVGRHLLLQQAETAEEAARLERHRERWGLVQVEVA